MLRERKTSEKEAVKGVQMKRDLNKVFTEGLESLLSTPTLFNLR